MVNEQHLNSTFLVLLKHFTTKVCIHTHIHTLDVEATMHGAT